MIESTDFVQDDWTELIPLPHEPAPFAWALIYQDECSYTYRVIGTQCTNREHAEDRCESVFEPDWTGWYSGPGRSFADPVHLWPFAFVGWIATQRGGLDV